MNQSRQHAPSPDYSTADSVVPVTITCRDCGDIEMQFSTDVAETIARMRCDECHEQHSDEAATFFRTNESAIKKALAHPLYLHKQGGMNDERAITCDECASPAAFYSGPVDHLDGKSCVCLTCGEPGRIDVDYDEGRGSIRFRAYTERELSEIAATMGEGAQ